MCITLHDWSSYIKPGMFFRVLAVTEGSIIGHQGKLKLFLFLNKNN